MDKRRMVQQYVERQKAYLPTYATEHPWNERHGTPEEPLLGNEFGFDTPVLRPRVPVSKTQSTQKAGPRRSQTRKTDSDNSSSHPGVPPEAGGPAMSQPRAKGKKDSIDTDGERAARLADRRERKRKRRAIVNPQKQEAPKRGRTNDHKAKKPAALALLYGFSATNVTKDRLTLKPSPSLGVFNKGRASAKKKVTATSKSSSKNVVFSESAFLNRESEKVADISKVGSDSSSLSSGSTPQAARIMSRTKQGRKERTKAATGLKPSQASTRTTAESEVWDIELQSKLPSSAHDVSSDFEANDSAAVVLDLHGAEWSTSLNVAERGERPDKVRARSLSVTHSLSRGCCSRSDVREDRDLGVAQAAVVPSVHPSHSASQVGRGAGDVESSRLRLVTSKYFTSAEPVSVQEFTATSPQTLRQNQDHAGLDVQEAAVEVPREVSPLNSLISVAQPIVEFRTRYDMDTDEFPSDWSPYDDYDEWADVPMEVGGCNLYQSWRCMSGELAGEGVEFDCTQGSHDPLAGESILGVEYSPGPWFGGEGLGSEEGSEGGCMREFLEGRALLYGVPEDTRCVGLSGLAQAEMDVASRLRDHWRPVRLW